MQRVIYSITSINEITQSFLETGLLSKSHATIIALSGNLGAGKTTFTQAVARALGVTETVTSPTFIIEKLYDVTSSQYPFKKLIHIDAYRLGSAKELEKLGWSQIAADPSNLILIEWPEKVAGLLPSDTIYCMFKTLDEQTRELIITDELHFKPVNE